MAERPDGGMVEWDPSVRGRRRRRDFAAAGSRGGRGDSSLAWRWATGALLLAAVASCQLGSARAVELPPGLGGIEGAGGCFPVGGALDVERACASAEVQRACDLCSSAFGEAAVFGTLELGASTTFGDFAARVRASAEVHRSLQGAAAGLLKHPGGVAGVVLLGAVECGEQAEGCVGVRFRIAVPVDVAKKLVEGYGGGVQDAPVTVHEAFGSLRGVSPSSLFVQVGPPPPASAVVRSVVVRHGDGGDGGDGAAAGDSALAESCARRLDGGHIVCRGVTGASVPLHSSESLTFSHGGWARELTAWGDNVFAMSLCGLGGGGLRAAEARSLEVVEAGETVGCRILTVLVSVENTRAATFPTSHQALLQAVVGKLADIPASDVGVGAVSDSDGAAPTGEDPLHWKSAGATVAVRLPAVSRGQEVEVRAAVGSNAVAMPRAAQAAKCSRGRCGVQNCLSLKGKQRCAFVESVEGSCADACR